MQEHIVMHHSDVNAVNTEADPFAVTPYTVKPALPENGRTKCILPPLSWNVLRFSAEGNI